MGNPSERMNLQCATLGLGPNLEVWTMTAPNATCELLKSLASESVEFCWDKLLPMESNR